MIAKKFLLAVTVAALPILLGATQDGQTAASPTFDPEGPAYVNLTSLRDKAEALLERGAPRAEQTTAWQALYDVAIKTRVGPQRLTHPMAGQALTMIAVLQQGGGDYTGALVKARQALDLMRPFRDQYADLYIQALSAAGYSLTSMGKPTEALVPLAEAADWSQSHFEKLPTEKRTRLVFMAKSNAEYAYAQALSSLGQAERAVEYQGRSLESRRTGLGANDPDTVASYGWYAIMLFRAGRRDDAEINARQAVEIAVDHLDPSHLNYARAMEVMGLILARSGRRAESVDYFQRSIDLKRKYGGTGNNNFYFALFNLGDSLIQLERYEDAAALALEAAKGWQSIQGANNPNAAKALGMAGIAAAGAGDARQAAQRLGEAFTMARTLDASERDIGGILLPALIVAEIDAGNTQRARALADVYLAESRATSPFAAANAELLKAFATGAPAASLARRLIDVMRGDRVLASSGELAQRDRSALELVLRVAVASDDNALALGAMVFLSGSKIAQANRLVTDRLQSADPALAARIRTEQDAAKAFRDADTALLKVLASGDGVAEARGRRDEAAAALDKVHADLTRDFPRWAEASGAAAPDLATIKAGLGRSEGVLAIVPAFDGVYTLTITHTVAKVRRTPLGRTAIIAQISRLRASLPTGNYDADAAHILYQQFFPAADAKTLRGVTQLRIAPTGPIAAIPFAALLEKRMGKVNGAAPWLIRRFAIEVASSISGGTAAPMKAASDGKFLGVGAPTPFGDARPSARVLAANAYYRGGLANPDALSDLPPLPGSATEVAVVARAFGPAKARLLTGDDASEAALRAMDLKPYSTILFATHGLVSGEMDGLAEPALVLARPRTGESGDGLLTASEVATLRLDADWVILSACNTAAGDRVEGAAYSGLAQAFRYAGARSLLLSHWPVRDDAASFITVETIANARKGMRRDVALQRAMLKLMRTRMSDAADPYLWAPYILVGGGLGGD